MAKRRKPDSGLKLDAAIEILLPLLPGTKGSDFQLSLQMLKEIEAISSPADRREAAKH